MLKINKKYFSYPYKLHQRFNDFEITDIKKYNDYNITLYKLYNDKLDNHYYYFHSNDINNSFGIILKTLPYSDKGVPHILEHTALCGSKKYPLKM